MGGQRDYVPRGAMEQPQGPAGHPPEPQSPCALPRSLTSPLELAPRMRRMVLTALLGMASSEVPVSTMASQPKEQAMRFPPTETLGGEARGEPPGCGTRGRTSQNIHWDGGAGARAATERGGLRRDYLSMVICQ